MTRHTKHRLYGGPLDGEIVDLAKTKPHIGQLRFTVPEMAPASDWARTIFDTRPPGPPLTLQVAYVERHVTFGDRTFILWVWSELK